ncbi:DUF885 domain-containing protein [Aeoliella sp. ICT_H6.2]|uniref:DUF885 domain-containing protein n=1 Tax=Aeoliella straminimaris TaxID=2954799 RepID=A0A9X2FJ51_9BACT|nr:DUF885 domain-containing protein [Aeoliella straminimaris]MCO6046711.1 DUF885 domain-containing protein [Aeoliella straminimaris]
MNAFYWLLGMASMLLVLPASVVLAESESDKLHRLIDENWEYRLAESPLMATRVGDHRANDRLDSLTPQDIERRTAKTAEFLEQLEAIDRDQLEGDDRIHYAVMKRELESDLAEDRFKTYLMPINNRSGFHISFPEIRREVPLVTTEDFENYIARLNDFGRYADEHITLMREGVRQGYTMPSIIMEGSLDSVDAHVVSDPERSLMYEPLKQIPATVPTSEHERLQQAARAAISESVVPAYQRLGQFMRTEYLPNCRDTIAARALPDGADFYRFRAVKHTTLDDITPEAIHRRGLDEVKRIRGEMDEIIKRVGFEGDFQEFVEHLRTDPKFYAKTPEALQQHTALICKRMDGKLPELFRLLPRTSYGLRPIPDYIAPKTTAAYYQPPAGDGTRAGYYCLNTYDLPSRPLYMLEALSFHESVPGHHLQIALQYELEDLPEFRKFAGFNVFVEGWALYSERLGLEVGFYEDPYSDFGRLSMEIWRACRLVVDPGMHYLGWSRQQAIDYMAENTALSMLDIRSEVDRYIGWPGQAVAYKIGELRIRELRALAEAELAEKFDIREFHAVVLSSGAVPLDVLEENVRAWVASVKAGSE